MFKIIIINEPYVFTPLHIENSPIHGNNVQTVYYYYFLPYNASIFSFCSL